MNGVQQGTLGIHDVHRDYTDAIGTLVYRGSAALGRGTGWTTGIARFAADRVQRSQRYRTSVRELAALNDTLLSDIGIDRGEIPSVVRALVDKPTPTPTRSPRRYSRLPSSFATAVGKRVQQGVEAYRCWRERRATLAALSALDANGLRDIGLHYGDLQALANGIASIDAINHRRNCAASTAGLKAAA